MERQTTNPYEKIWLIGDSKPKNNSYELQFPLDPRHPTVHNIFTPIFDQIQEELFDFGYRVDKNKLFRRNAVEDVTDWGNYIKRNEEVKEMKNIININKPIIIFSFGSNAFELCRHALKLDNEQ